MSIGRRPTGQDSKCLPTKPASSAAYPHAILLLVVRRLAPLAVADARRLSTDWTPTWQLLQADPSYPGTALSSGGGHEIKRITAGVKACRQVLPAEIRPVTGFHPPGVLNIKRKKEYSCGAALPSREIGRYKRASGSRYRREALYESGPIPCHPAVILN